MSADDSTTTHANPPAELAPADSATTAPEDAASEASASDFEDAIADSSNLSPKVPDPISEDHAKKTQPDSATKEGGDAGDQEAHGTPTSPASALPPSLTSLNLASSKQRDSGASMSAASEAAYSRPFSLTSVPATPSTGGPHHVNGFAQGDGPAALPGVSETDLGDPARIINGDSPFPEDVPLPKDRRASVASTVWRNSMGSSPSRRTTGDLSNIGLDDPVDGEDGDREPEGSVISSSADPSAASSGMSVRERRRTTIGSSAALVGLRTVGEGKTEDADFMLARINAENAMLARDPKSASLDGSAMGSPVGESSRRKSLIDGRGKLKESFERVHEEGAGNGDTDDGLIDWDFWGAVMNDYEHVAKTQPKELSRAIQAGIPPALRGMMWQLMSSSKDQELELIYSHLLGQTSIHEKAISRDLGRTFPQHEYFQEGGGVGQDSLAAVCKAYSLYDEEVGYTQGLQFIMGPLLLNMPDEEAFCVLVRLMKSYDLRSHFTPNMPGLQLHLFQFDRLLEELLPHVFMHLLRQGIKSSMYASQWFLTLFGYRFPLELVSVVLDLVLAEGVEAVFRFALALMKKNETRICELDFDKLLDFLKLDLFDPYRNEPPPSESEDEAPPIATYRASDFVREALQVKITPVMLDQYAAEWDAMCRQQNAHTLELEGLRQANSQLSTQVRRLEASLAQINEEHCDLVKQVVMAKLAREELEDELIRMKMKYAESQQVAAEQSVHHRGSMSSTRSNSIMNPMSPTSKS